MVNAIQFALFVGFMLASGAANAADDNATAWNALRADGFVALIRHASAPGPVGDPADYKLDDCATQRNLSEQGREERVPSAHDSACSRSKSVRSLAPS